MNKKYHKYIWILLFYIAVAIFYTWPTIINLNSVIYAQSGDAFANIYDLWKISFSDVSLSFPNQVVYMFTAKTLRAIFSEITIYNLFIFSSFIFTAIAGFLLIKKIVKDETSAFFGGLMLMLAPFRIAQSIQHLHFADISFLLLFIYFLIKSRERKKWYDLVGVFLTFSLLTLINYQYGFLAGIIFVIYLIACFINPHKKGRYVFLYTLMPFVGSISIILIFNQNFIADMMSISYGQDANYLTSRSFEELGVYSARWFYYLVPTPDNPIFRNVTSNLYGNVINTIGTNLTEQTIYLGIINLFFAIYALVNFKKINQFILGFSLLLIFFGIYISFSPEIIIWNTKIPSLSRILYDYIPFFRVYARFGIITYIGTIILSCYGIKFFVNKISNNLYKKIAIITILILIFADLLILPTTKTVGANVEYMPLSYKELAKINDSNELIIEYPVLPPEEPDSYEYLFWERVHSMPIYYNHDNTEEENEFIRSVSNLNSQEIIDELKNKKIKYIVIHKDKYSSEKAKKYPIEYNGGRPPLYNLHKLDLKYIGTYDDDIVYEIK